MARIERIRLYMEEAILQSRRSTCLRKQVGAVAIRDGRTIASGYNGVLPGVNRKYGIDKHGESQTVHAEANLVAYAAKYGIPLAGCELYTTMEPCRKCAELLLQIGFTKVTYLEGYRKHDGLRLLTNSTTQVFRVEMKGEDSVSVMRMIGSIIPEDAE